MVIVGGEGEDREDGQEVAGDCVVIRSQVGEVEGRIGRSDVQLMVGRE